MSTLGTNYGISELRIAYALEDAINFYLVDGTMPNEGTLYGISEKRLAIAIAENTSISGGSAAWGAITGNLASQSDLSTALSLKQNSLVSGTNIKTVNSATLLGSGDLAVQSTLVSGTNIKTVNSNSLLGSGDLSIATSPAGATGQIQFNNAGSFGANSQLFWNNVDNNLGINNVSPSAKLDLVSSSPTSIGLSIKGGVNQSANLWECRDSSGNVIAYFNPFLPSNSTFLKFQCPGWSLYPPYMNGTLLDISAGSQNIFKIYKNSGAGDESMIQLTSATGSQTLQFGIGAGSFSMSRNGAAFLQSGGSGTLMSPVAIEAGSTTQTANASLFGTARANNLRAIIGKRYSATQTQNIIEAQDESNGTLSAIAKADGSYGPASLTNAASTNSSFFYSTTLSRLAYKDSSGNVFAQNQRQFSTKTVNYTLTIADDYVRFNGASLTATLPNATTMSGHEFEIKNVNSTALTINTTSSQLMDSNLTVSLSQYEVLKVVSNGTNWDII